MWDSDEDFSEDTFIQEEEVKLQVFIYSWVKM